MIRTLVVRPVDGLTGSFFRDSSRPEGSRIPQSEHRRPGTSLDCNQWVLGIHILRELCRDCMYSISPSHPEMSNKQAISQQAFPCWATCRAVVKEFRLDVAVGVESLQSHAITSQALQL